MQLLSFCVAALVVAISGASCAGEALVRASAHGASGQGLIWSGVVGGSRVVWSDDDIQIISSDSEAEPVSILTLLKETVDKRAKEIGADSPGLVGKSSVTSGKMRILSVVGSVISIEVAEVEWVEGAGASTAAETHILVLDLATADIRPLALRQLEEMPEGGNIRVSQFVPEGVLFSALLKRIDEATCSVAKEASRPSSLSELLKANPCVGEIDGQNAFLDPQTLEEFWLADATDKTVTFRVAVYSQDTHVLRKLSIPVTVAKKDVMLPPEVLATCLAADRELIGLKNRYAGIEIRNLITAPR